jgi:alkyldihydroxyacetonephosphate synthase
MIRLATPAETTTLLALGGVDPGGRLAGVGRRYLALRGIPSDAALLLVAAEGRQRIVAAAMNEIPTVLRGLGAVRAPAALGRRWLAGRYRAASLRDALWARGYGVDTVETATTWAALPDLAADMGARVGDALRDDGERVHAFSHLSHVYGSGSSLYTTIVFRLAGDPDETLDRWRRLKAAASEAVVRHAATISHQHGVGRDHCAWLGAEKGPLGLALIDAARRTLDPDGTMNPGVLLPEAEA